ncbi:prepilin-type N-terminal cleavage/methylation domain-containing protein [Bdellovibrio sp. SKB1291214]|uniref:prepilin-type N-terminal cleavage/methylation domain-containing protein n=1 Tax=Bdellovibrio sp. SKB1291214 TaxID=1732569 RepID=UPI000B51C234|nr:prepilin-type N-terminal cleavage/methylation domain-containing protein [Bdellovibrio sp. SKB1291214]UYL07540.1 prepilin-type N-terminal cleavage/methylation domain-containing protein [Bdellovibrio sp. SKB1291214]
MKNHLSSNKGFTLVEVLVATGLVALISLVMTTVMVKMQKDVTIYSAKSGVESMRSAVRMNAINGASILRSAALTENKTLSACLSGTACSTKKDKFTLIDALGAQLAGDNVFYDLQGKSCSTWSATCPLKITSEMQLVCASTATTGMTGAKATTPVASCARADAMNVFVQIEYHQDLSKLKGVELRPINDTVTVALSSYYNTTLTSSLTTNQVSSDLVCEEGSYMTGVDTNGKVQCQKVTVYVGSNSSGGGGNDRGGGNGNGGGHGSNSSSGNSSGSAGTGSCSR